MDPPSKGVHIACFPSSDSLASPVDHPHANSFSSCSDLGKAGGGEETFVVGEYHLSACPICFERFSLENPAIVVACGHGFHLHCLEDWRQRSPVCPVCMKPMQGEGIPMMSAHDTRRRRRYKGGRNRNVSPSDVQEGYSPYSNECVSAEGHPSDTGLKNAAPSCSTALRDEQVVSSRSRCSFLNALRALTQWCSRDA